MSLRVVMIALLLLVASALGVIAYQIAVPRTTTPPPPKVVEAPPPAPKPTVSYLVAARPLSPGTLMRSEDFTVRTVPEDEVPQDAIMDSPNARIEVRGGLVRRVITTGAPLRTADVTRSRERGFLSAVLRPGTRAVSIGVDQVSGVAGLIWPGDQVDVILTQEFAPVDKGRIVTSETILTDVRVIAVDQDIAQGAASSGAAGKVAATVTLEVSSDQAEKLAVSGRLGRLSLAVRSLADPNQPITVTGGVSGADVSDAFAKANGAAGPKIQVIEGDHRSEVRFK
jgi:pilus assembly protein CpaB